MEVFIKFLEANGLTAVALAIAWWALKFYIGRDIEATRAGIQQSTADHQTLRKYVEDCEDALEKKLSDYDKEFTLLKQDHNHLATDIKTSIGKIEKNLEDHTAKEEVYQRDITAFMGYVYRYMGGATQGPGAPSGFPHGTKDLP